MKKFILIFGFGILMLNAYSQTVLQGLLSSSGDSFKNSKYNLDWSVSELQTETYYGEENILTQGFHQNNYLISTIEQLEKLPFEISIFPNPTTDIITLKAESSANEILKYIITDIYYKTLLTNNIEHVNHINFSNYKLGVYFISVSQNNKIVKSFKIIKI